jgi:hypothetical protein
MPDLFGRGTFAGFGASVISMPRLSRHDLGQQGFRNRFHRPIVGWIAIPDARRPPRDKSVRLGHRAAGVPAPGSRSDSPRSRQNPRADNHSFDRVVAIFDDTSDPY